MDDFNNVITNLYIYNATLFKGGLEGKIEATPVPEIWFRPKIGYPYHFNLDVKEIVLEMQGYQGVLFVAASDRLSAYNLKKGNNAVEFFEKEILSCKSIRIDYKNQWLFIVSESRGITVLNISNPKKPVFLMDFKLHFVENEQNVITDFDIVSDVAFLAVRNKGIIRIDYMEGKFGQPELLRTIKKITLDDPQDVRFCPYNQYLYIIDSERGFIILDTRNNGIVFERNLLKEGTPKKILLYHKDAIIQTERGLFLFKFASKQLKEMLRFKVGALTKYYNHFVFSKGFSTNILTLGKPASYLDDRNMSQFDNFEQVYTFDNRLETIK